MKTIVIDTASSYLYLAFLSADKIIHEEFFLGKGRHSENFLETLKAGLRRHELSLSDFDRIYLGIGPGSYTGLRVGVTVAKVLGWALNIPVYTASSLSLLASGYFHKDGIYAVSIIAKKNYYFGKVVQVKEGKVLTLVDDFCADAQTYMQTIKDYDCFLVNEDNYLVDPTKIEFRPVANLHELNPNYLRRSV